MSPFDRDRFSERLLAAIKLRDLSIEQAARRCDMPISSLECWIYKRHLPGTQALANLAAGLEVSLDWLVLGVGRATIPLKYSSKRK